MSSAYTPKWVFRVRLSQPFDHSDSESLGFSNVWWHRHRICEVLYVTRWSEPSFLWTQVEFPYSERRDQVLYLLVGAYALCHFCKEVCLPLGPWCKGREATCCCRSWAQKGFWACEHMWHTWAYDSGLQEILHVKQPIKYVKQAEKSADFLCSVLFAVNFFPRHVSCDWFSCSGIQLFQRHDDTQYN